LHEMKCGIFWNEVQNQNCVYLYPVSVGVLVHNMKSVSIA